MIEAFTIKTIKVKKATRKAITNLKKTTFANAKANAL